MMTGGSKKIMDKYLVIYYGSHIAGHNMLLSGCLILGLFEEFEDTHK